MSVETPASRKAKKGLFGGILSGGNTIWLAAAVAGLVAGAGAFAIMGQAAAKATYYVLGRDVPTRTLVTQDMLVPVETSVDGVPVNAFDPVYVRDNQVFTRVPLRAGDLITASTAGPLEQITKNLPGNFVAASFSVTPDNAVAGKVSAGDHIDLIAVGSGEAAAGETAKVVLHNVLVLDVTVNPQSIAATSANTTPEGEAATTPTGPESEVMRAGIPSVYTVGVTPEDAVKLALVRNADLMVVMTGNAPDAELDVSEQMVGVFGAGAVGDSGKGTPGEIKKGKAAEEAAAVDGDPVALTDVTYTDPAGVLWTQREDGLWVSDGEDGETILDEGTVPDGYDEEAAGN